MSERIPSNARVTLTIGARVPGNSPNPFEGRAGSPTGRYDFSGSGGGSKMPTMLDSLKFLKDNFSQLDTARRDFTGKGARKANDHVSHNDIKAMIDNPKTPAKAKDMLSMLLSRPEFSDGGKGMRLKDIDKAIGQEYMERGTGGKSYGKPANTGGYNQGGSSIIDNIMKSLLSFIDRIFGSKNDSHSSPFSNGNSGYGNSGYGNSGYGNSHRMDMPTTMGGGSPHKAGGSMGKADALSTLMRHFRTTDTAYQGPGHGKNPDGFVAMSDLETVANNSAYNSNLRKAAKVLLNDPEIQAKGGLKHGDMSAMIGRAATASV